MLTNLKNEIYMIKETAKYGSVFGGPGMGMAIRIPAEKMDYSLTLHRCDYSETPMYQIMFNETYKNSESEIGGGGWPKAVFAYFKMNKKGLGWELEDNLNGWSRQEIFGHAFTRKSAEKKLYNRAYKTIDMVSRLAGVPMKEVKDVNKD